MRQQLSKALQWGVLGLAVFAVGAMAVIINRASADRPPATSQLVAQPAPVDTAPPSSAPKPPPSHKLTRAEIAQQKKAAAIAAKAAKYKPPHNALEDGNDLTPLGWVFGLGAWALIIYGLIAWRRGVRRRRAIIDGEGFEEGRMRARARAGLV